MVQTVLYRSLFVGFPIVYGSFEIQLAFFSPGIGIIGIARSTAKYHEEHGVNSNGAVNSSRIRAENCTADIESERG